MGIYIFVIFKALAIKNCCRYKLYYIVIPWSQEMLIGWKVSPETQLQSVN